MCNNQCVLMYCTVRIWDVRPFAPHERCVKIFQGNQHTYEKVSTFLSLCYSDTAPMCVYVLSVAWMTVGIASDVL